MFHSLRLNISLWTKWRQPGQWYGWLSTVGRQCLTHKDVIGSRMSMLQGLHFGYHLPWEHDIPKRAFLVGATWWNCFCEKSALIVTQNSLPCIAGYRSKRVPALWVTQRSTFTKTNAFNNRAAEAMAKSSLKNLRRTPDFICLVRFNSED